jgi:catechol 2,3-dioxygenase-like lactoylglutathione lyase family enzyme
MSVAVGHVGMTVPSLADAVAWYRDVLGCELLAEPTEVRAGAGHGGRMASDVFGAQFGAFRQAHLGAANDVALELFEFIEPRTEPPSQPFAFWQTGPFHLCVVDADIDGLVERIRTSGGRQRTAVWAIRPGEPYRMCYCQDPFGIVLEVYSHSHEQTYGVRRSAVA